MRPGGARDSNPRRWVSDPTNQNFSTRHNRLKSTELRTFERDGPWTTTQTTTYLAPCFGDFDNSVSIWSHAPPRSEEHTSELQSLMRISYAVFCLKKKNTIKHL